MGGELDKYVLKAAIVERLSPGCLPFPLSAEAKGRAKPLGPKFTELDREPLIEGGLREIARGAGAAGQIALADELVRVSEVIKSSEGLTGEELADVLSDISRIRGFANLAVTRGKPLAGIQLDFDELAHTPRNIEAFEQGVISTARRNDVSPTLDDLSAILREPTLPRRWIMRLLKRDTRPQRIARTVKLLLESAKAVQDRATPLVDEAVQTQQHLVAYIPVVGANNALHDAYAVLSKQTWKAVIGPDSANGHLPIVNTFGTPFDDAQALISAVEGLLHWSAHQHTLTHSDLTR